MALYMEEIQEKLEIIYRSQINFLYHIPQKVKIKLDISKQNLSNLLLHYILVIKNELLR